MAPDDKQSGNDSASIADILRAYQEIESFLGVDEETIKMPVKVLVAALPAGALRNPVPPEIADSTVPVTVKDLFFKLTKGKVTVTVKDIVEALPPQVTAGGTTINPTTEVKLPLSAVVAAVDPKALREKMAAKSHKADLNAIPDPFSSLKGALDSVSKKEEPKPAMPTPPPAAAPKPIPVPAATAAPPPSIAPRPLTPPPTQAAPPPTQAVEATPPPAPVIPQPTAAPTQATTPPPPPPPTQVTPPPPPAAPVVPAPAEVPRTVVPEPQAAAPAAEIKVPQPPPPAATQPPKPRVPPKPKPQLPPEDERDYLEPESLGGVNINTANAEQLTSLSGVTPLIARAIVQYREQKGLFRSIFDLINVERLGRSTFRRMTGIPYNKNHVHRRRKLALLLGMPSSKVGALPEVAAAISRVNGLAGCVISDRDGMLLAQSGSTEFAAAMSAVIPKMYRETNDSMSVVNVGSVESVSLCINRRMFTVVSSEHVNLTVMHEPRKVTWSKVLLVQRIAAELTWVLSHRAYVGKTV